MIHQSIALIPYSLLLHRQRSRALLPHQTPYAQDQAQRLPLRLVQEQVPVHLPQRGQMALCRIMLYHHLRVLFPPQQPQPIMLLSPMH